MLPSSWIVIGSSTIRSSGARLTPSGVTELTITRRVRLRPTTQGYAGASAPRRSRRWCLAPSAGRVRQHEPGTIRASVSAIDIADGADGALARFGAGVQSAG